jgi:hypothetical protein
MTAYLLFPANRFFTKYNDLLWEHVNVGLGKITIADFNAIIESKSRDKSRTP